MNKLSRFSDHVDQDVKDRILDILKKVALSYRGINQVEEFILGRIKQDFKRL